MMIITSAIRSINSIVCWFGFLKHSRITITINRNEEPIADCYECSTDWVSESQYSSEFDCFDRHSDHISWVKESLDVSDVSNQSIPLYTRVDGPGDTESVHLSIDLYIGWCQWASEDRVKDWTSVSWAKDNYRRLTQRNTEWSTWSSIVDYDPLEDYT